MGKFEIKKDKAGKFRFNLKASNGQVILSSEAYNTKSAVENGIASVRKNSQNDAMFDMKIARNGKPRFNLKATNGQVIGTSQMYSSTFNCSKGIASVMKNAPKALVVDVSVPQTSRKVAFTKISRKRRKRPEHPKFKIGITKEDSIVTKIPIEIEEHYLLDPAIKRKEIFKSLKYDELAKVNEFFDFNQEDLAELLHVNPSTISRWKQNNSDIGLLQSKFIMDIDKIVTIGIRIFGNETNFKEWLNNRNYALGDQKPVDLLTDPYRTELVEDALNALSWGNYM